MKQIITGATCAALASLAVSLPAQAQDGSTVEAVKSKGVVSCAANGGRQGMSSLDSQGKWVGLDVDTCRAVAAAVLGDAEAINMVKATTQTRFPMLQTGEVDIVTANATWTLSRDAELGINFTVTTFYDGQGFMVPKDLGVSDVAELDGADLCVPPGSNSEKVAADVAQKNNISFNSIVIEDQSELQKAFFNGRCDVHILSTSGLAAARSSLADNPDDWIILPGIYGKDPMGPAVRQGDANWNDIVNWVIFAMIAAEEHAITSANVDEMKTSGDPEVENLLGVKGDLGAKLGLDNEWAYRIIKTVGSYGEVYDRNFGEGSPLKLARGLNGLAADGGMMYSPPFK
ncbi:amino acid ABC transporter substrate-binding protein [Cognatishimia maritima]|uniref:General L-amino acid transport system substrate-binding protein n=1 Tax=Cognatishimia maritima TaxID=870908 RepID=A0A1M5LCJ8_9RHOB|nr:amino acid ABC transporter substrate-binding protein [Cognatishimia maritima]SHG62439.1 general L-amino acid transport system substrate-binding protein [Cognatishimia maritima]